MVSFGQSINAGCFRVEFIKTNHSIQDAAALAIYSPAGTVIHTGDFKVDYTPVFGDQIDLQRFAEIGKKGVLALCCDSTNAERPGFTQSERTVGRTFDNIFADNTDTRIIIATFASNVDRVQQIIDHRPPIMKGQPSPFYNLFHGLLYCADCGKSMQARYEKVGRKDVNRTTKEKREPIDKTYYICQTYNRLGCKVCPSHKIEARALYNLVLTDIQELAAQVIRDEDAFYQRLTRRLENRYQTDASSLHRELNRLMARNQEIDDTFLSLYTDKSKGILTDQRFLKLTMAMENEQKENNGRIAEIQALLRDSIDQESDIRQFITEIRQYASITELDEGILNHLIDKIMIGDVKKVNGEKVQEVRIFYNFVGEVAEMAA